MIGTDGIDQVGEEGRIGFYHFLFFSTRYFSCLAMSSFL